MADDAKEEDAPPATAPMEVDDIAEAAADAMEVPAPAPAPAPAILADLKFDDATVDQALEACAKGQEKEEHVGPRLRAAALAECGRERRPVPRRASKGALHL